MDKPIRKAEKEKDTAIMNSRMGLYLFFAGCSGLINLAT